MISPELIARLQEIGETWKRYQAETPSDYPAGRRPDDLDAEIGKLLPSLGDADSSYRPAGQCTPHVVAYWYFFLCPHCQQERDAYWVKHEYEPDSPEVMVPRQVHMLWDVIDHLEECGEGEEKT